MRDAAKGEDDPKVAHCSQFLLEKRPAGRDLATDRLVLRWHAAHRVGDAAVDKPYPIIAGATVTAFRPAFLQERRIKQVACVVAGKGTTRLVRAVKLGRQPQDQQPGLQRPKGWHRRIVIAPKALSVLEAKA